MNKRLGLLVGTMLLGLVPVGLALQRAQGDVMERFRTMSVRAETEGLAESYVGVVTSEGVTPGLFEIRSTGVSTEPVRRAADAFLASLTDAQREKTLFQRVGFSPEPSRFLIPGS